MDSIKEKQTIIAISGAAFLVMLGYFYWCCKKRSSHPVTLDGKTKIPLTLIDKKIVSHDTRRFRFSLPSENHILGLPVGGFITVSANIDEKLVVKPYTPITSDDDVGVMDLMIKVYPDGKMSPYMDNLALGDTIMIRGPSGKIRYHGNGVFEVEKGKDRKESKTYNKVGMIAGGSGITPMLQVILDILKREEDTTQITLLFSNKTAEDMLCREMLDECVGEKFTVHHTLTREDPPSGMLGGRVDRDKVEKYLPAPAEDTVILLCGPGGLVRGTCIPILDEMGHNHLAF